MGLFAAAKLTGVLRISPQAGIIGAIAGILGTVFDLSVMPTPPQDDDLSQYMAKRPAKPKQQQSYSAPEWNSGNSARSVPKPPDPRPVRKVGRNILLGVGVLAIAVTGWWFTRPMVYEAPRPQRWVETESPDDSPVLVIVNATQQVMSVELEGDYSYQFQIPACLDCEPTTDPALIERYCESAAEHSASIQAGTYFATLRLNGQPWAQGSQWLFSDGWFFFECYIQ